jgi:porphyrinogen peroxidase
MNCRTFQQAILAPVPALARSMAFRLVPETDPWPSVNRLANRFDPSWGAIGFGDGLVRTLGRQVAGLRPLPALTGAGCSVPSTQHAVWVCLGGDDAGDLFDRAELVKAALVPELVLEDEQHMFRYAGGRDLTGYEDGTENPTGDDAIEAAIVAQPESLAGSSFVAVQRWIHDLQHFHAHSAPERDAMIGRRRDSNEEIDDAPESAHVKRTAQESYTPEAFMVRRSMPWSTAFAKGLEFVAFGKSLDAYERVLRRMVGEEDGIVDALFRFSRPVTGGYYWCPPVRDGRLDLSASISPAGG